MPVITRNFDRYRMTLFSGTPMHAEVNPLNADGTTLARLHFVREGDPLPANTMSGGVFHLSYPASRLADMMDMLRYETPLYLHFNTDTRAGGISTLNAEIVGEQEL